MNFSLEIGPHTDLDTLPPVKDVYVTMLPGGDYRETADKSGDLVKKGFNPVPHFPARSISNDEELKAYVSRSVCGPISSEKFIFPDDYIICKSCQRNSTSDLNEICCQK